MATQSPPFALQNASHGAALFRQAAFSAFTEGGTISAADLVATAQSTPNMSVQVTAGRVWVPGTQVSNVSGGNFSPQAAYFGINDAPLSVTITTANATNPRIDVIYVAVNDAFYSGSLNTLVIGVATGTAAASPVAPAIPNNSIALAQVAVAANATSIVSGNIAVTAGLPMVALGGVNPVTATDAIAGLRTGQYRDHPTLGLERWNASASNWDVVTATGWCRAQARQTTAQTGLASSTWVGITFNTTDYDPFGAFSGGSTFTCPAGQAGLYLVSASVTVGATAANVYGNSRILKNGSPIPSSGSYGDTLAAANGGVATAPRLVQLAAGDTLTLQGYVVFTSWATAIFVDNASAMTVVRLA